MRQRHAKRFTDHLRRGGRSEKLAAPARRGASAASQLGRLLQGKQSMREARADGLNDAGIFALLRREGNAARLT